MPKTRSRSYLTPQEVAQMLMVSPVTIRQWANKGWLRAQVTAGGHRRFSRRDIETFARERGIALNLGDAGLLKVLIVEDDHQVANLLTEVLAQRCEHIITHIARDGFEVCHRLKSDPATKLIDIVAMTGSYTPENVDRILNAGAKACLAKPLDINLLMRELGLKINR